MYKEGHISEELFDALSVPQDQNMDGTVTERNAGILLENRQRTKILSSEAHILERRWMIHRKKLQLYLKQKELYDSETREYELNEICEKKLKELYEKSCTMDNQIGSCATDTTFADICGNITIEMIQAKQKYVLNNEMKAFLWV